MPLDQSLYYRITDLPPAQSITGAEVVEAVQNGKNVKFTLEQLFIAGKSAYDIAVDNGYVGSVDDWLASLKGKDGLNGSNGLDGRSAYQVAVSKGYVGSETDWLTSLIGKDGRDGLPGADGTNGLDGRDGRDGTNGTNGTNGLNGVDGLDGKSAYQIAVENGYTGSISQWLASLKGDKGDPGANDVDGAVGLDGKSAYQSALENGFVGTEAEWLASLKGADGTNGTNGVNGTNGSDGSDGQSAYALAVSLGFVGTEAEWLLSLKGADGTNGRDGRDGIDGEPGPIGPSPTIFPYDITFSAFEQFAPSMILGATVLARPVLLPKDLASSQAYCDTPPSSTPAKFYLSVDEVIIATLTFTPGNKIGTWSMPADVNINVGQVLRCRSAAPADFDTSILGIQLTVVGIADISGV